MNNPCKGCTRREIGCHSYCEDYLIWKEKWDERREAERIKCNLDYELDVGRFERRKRRGK